MSAFEDPARKASARPVSVLSPVVAPPAPAPSVLPAPAPMVGNGPTQPAPQGAAEAAFPHLTDSAAPNVRKVKSQAIHTDTAGMISDLAKASGLSAAELPTARRTASDLLHENAKDGVNNIDQFAYEMATTRRETHMGNWMNEFGGNAYFEKKYGMNSSHRDDLHNTQPGDGAKFHGRGLVQTTGRRNYTDWTDRMAKENYQHNGEAVDLVNHPELAADPQIAAHIAVKGMRDGTFTGRKLGDYVNDTKTDFYNARRVINGTDKAQEIADQATSFQGVLKNHSSDYTGAMIKDKLAGLPSAAATELGGNPNALTPELFSPNRLGTGASNFRAPDKLLNNSIGHFDPSVPLGKFTDAKVHATE